MLNEIRLFEELKEAYETTTKTDNTFQSLIKSINWDSTFQEDGETYLCKGDFTLIIENLNPFEEQYKPSVIFGNEIVYFSNSS